MLQQRSRYRQQWSGDWEVARAVTQQYQSDLTSNKVVVAQARAVSTLFRLVPKHAESTAFQQGPYRMATQNNRVSVSVSVNVSVSAFARCLTNWKTTTYVRAV